MRWTVSGIQIGLLAFTLLLMGCPYQSQVPLDSPIPLDPRLLGAWHDGEAPDSPVYHVEKRDGSTYRIRSASDSGDTDFDGFLCRLEGRTYLNLYDRSSSSYSFFWLELKADGSSVTLHPVTENVTERFSQSEELRSFVKENQGHSFFFEKPTTYVRP